MSSLKYTPLHEITAVRIQLMWISSRSSLSIDPYYPQKGISLRKDETHRIQEATIDTVILPGR
jgi:hypothetical protein